MVTFASVVFYGEDYGIWWRPPVTETADRATRARRAKSLNPPLKINEVNFIIYFDLFRPGFVFRRFERDERGPGPGPGMAHEWVRRPISARMPRVSECRTRGSPDPHPATRPRPGWTTRALHGYTLVQTNCHEHTQAHT